jgi:dolichol-phosphate mannosyltransferase
MAISDPTSGFKCFRRHVIEKVLDKGIMSNGYAFQIEVNYLCRKIGFKIGK